jgi:hypothetical protein
MEIQILDQTEEMKAAKVNSIACVDHSNTIIYIHERFRLLSVIAQDYIIEFLKVKIANRHETDLRCDSKAIDAVEKKYDKKDVDIAIIQEIIPVLRDEKNQPRVSFLLGYVL